MFTLLMLVTNIVAAFQGVPRSVKDAADGMGLTPVTRVLTVELPLATPLIIAGIRIGARRPQRGHNHRDLLEWNVQTDIEQRESDDVAEEWLEAEGLS